MLVRSELRFQGELNRTLKVEVALAGSLGPNLVGALLWVLVRSIPMPYEG